MSRDIVFLNGSPSATSRSAFVASAVADEVRRGGLRPLQWSLSDFDPADVFFARSAAPPIARFIEATKTAHGIVLATPVYKATYSGALKAIVDLIPPDALVGRPILGVATARVAVHGADVGDSFRALSAFFKARALSALVVLDDELQIAGGGGVLSVDAEQRVRKAARALVVAAEEEAVLAVSRP